MCPGRSKSPPVENHWCVFGHMSWCSFKVSGDPSLNTFIGPPGITDLNFPCIGAVRTGSKEGRTLMAESCEVQKGAGLESCDVPEQERK